MSDEQLALIALLGAGAAAGGLALTRGSIEPPSVWYRLSWPREVEGENVVAFFRHLAGDRRRHVLALEIVASRGRLSYRLGIAKRHSEEVLAVLSSYLPGVAAKLIEQDIARAPDAACVFHAKPNTDSTPSRTVIPRQAEHPFHAKPNSDSTPSRTVCGGSVEPLSGS